MTFSLAMLCALEIEAKPIIDILEMKEKEEFFDPRLGFKLFSSKLFPKTCLIQFGKCQKNGVDRIGTQIAAIAAWETIRTLSPNYIGSVGTAGGFQKKGASIGDVYLSERHICFHGRHIPVPEYASFELGHYPVMHIPNFVNIKRGIISSSDAIPLSKHDALKMTKIKTDAKDMEAAAIAEIAYASAVPMFALKSISDFIDSPQDTHTQFLANFKTATESLARALKSLLCSYDFT